MKYEHFEILLDNWQAFQRSVHMIPDSHPMKKYHKTLLTKIKKLPFEKQEEYFDLYYKR